VPFWELPGGRHGPGACAPSPVRLGRRRGERRARLSCEICRCAYQHLQQRARNLDFGAAWKKLGPDRSLFPLADLASRPGNLFAPCAAAPAPARVHARCATPRPQVQTSSPPPPSLPEKGAPLPEARKVVGDGLAPGRSAGVRVAPRQNAAALLQHLRRGPASRARMSPGVSERTETEYP
jgi:hypothetical protein